MQKDAQNGWVLNKRHEGVIYGLGWFFAIFSVIMWLFLGISYMIEKDHFPKPKHKTLNRTYQKIAYIFGWIMTVLLLIVIISMLFYLLAYNKAKT